MSKEMYGEEIRKKADYIETSLEKLSEKSSIPPVIVIRRSDVNYAFKIRKRPSRKGKVGWKITCYEGDMSPRGLVNKKKVAVWTFTDCPQGTDDFLDEQEASGLIELLSDVSLNLALLRSQG